MGNVEWMGLVVLLAYPVLGLAWYSVFKWADNYKWGKKD